MALPTQDRERRLKISLLRYFTQGHSIHILGQEADKFPGFTADELKDAARGLVAAGFLKRARGRTKAATYLISEDGLATLTALEALED